MRPYGIVSPMFWTGGTGKRLRQDAETQVIALYLMTGPHSHQSGIYFLPLMYLLHETGISNEGASKALTRLSEEAFCTYDQAAEWIWVREMAAWQIGTELSPSDKRCKGLQQYLETLPKLSFLAEFVERYRDDFHLAAIRPFEGPPKGHSSNRTDQDQDQDQDQERSTRKTTTRSARSPTDQRDQRTSSGRGSRLPDDFTPDRDYALNEIPDLDFEREAEKFRDHWRAQSGQKGVKADWSATWRTWVRNAKQWGTYARAPKSPTNGPAAPVFR